LFGDTPGGALTTRTAVYRIEDLSHGQHRFKVDVNARENHMSGARSERRTLLKYVGNRCWHV
jgi:hypothetical protein